MSPASIELGIGLPNGGPAPSVAEVLRTAQAADDLGFDSVWVSEHVIVSAEAPASYHQSIDGLSVLSHVAAGHERLGLGTSVVILPLHNPFLLARRAAALQLLSGGRFRLGVGVGWHEPEFRFIGVPFVERGARADEMLRLMKALWAGQPSFSGRWWSYVDASFGPLPDAPPEIWVGGGSAALRRAREHDGVYHPIGPEPDDVRRMLEEWPEVRVVPRLHVREGPGEAAERLRTLIDAGAGGAVLRFGDVESMEAFAADALPALRS